MFIYEYLRIVFYAKLLLKTEAVKRIIAIYRVQGSGFMGFRSSF